MKKITIVGPGHVGESTAQAIADPPWCLGGPTTYIR